MKKNILSKLFCLVLVLSLVLCLGIVASAEETASGTLSDTISWTLEDGVLTLTGTGATPKYTASPFAAYKADVTSVVIGEGITRIEEYLFYEMENIQSVQLPSTATAITLRAFSYCTALKEITIPANVSVIGAYAFLNSGITDVYFESATPPATVSTSSPFGGCSYTVHTPCNSTGWTEDTIANWGGGSKTLKAGHRIEAGKCVYCEQYICGANVTASFVDGVLTLTGTGATNKYTAMNEAHPFYSIKDSVTSVVIGEGITRIEEFMFYQMKNITSVQLPSTLEAITLRAFAYCEGLKEITIPENLSVIGAYAFMNSGLTDVYFENATPPKTISSTSPFGGCSYKVHVPCNGSGWDITNWGGSSKTLVYDHKIEANACVYCEAIGGQCGTDVYWVLEEGTLTLFGTGATNKYTASPFAAYKADVTSVVIGEGITRIEEYLFYQMENIQSVQLPSTVEAITLRAFSYCTNLKEITIPENLSVIGAYAFLNSGITDVYFESATPPKTVSTTSPFGGCSYKVHVPCNSTAWTSATIASWGGSSKTLVYDHKYEGVICTICGVTEDGSNLCGDRVAWNFDEETGVLTLTGIGATNKYTAMNEAHPFYSIKDSVTSVVIGEGITRIEEFMFYQMANIQSVQLPSTLEAITLRAFAYCSALKEITIPENLSVLGAYAFMNSGITDVYFENTTPPKTISANSPFGGCSYRVHVPCNGTGWDITNWGGSTKFLVLDHQFEGDTCTVCQGKKVYALVEEGVEVSYCCTLTEACEARFSGQMIRLLCDTEEDAVLSKNLYIDLAGHNLSGVIDCGEEELFILDSSTDEYNADNCGVFSCVDIDGNAIVPVRHVNTKLANYYHYLAVEVEGGYAFHRFDLEITHISLKPAVTGVGYKAQYVASTAVMEQIASCGYSLQLGDLNAIVRNKAGFSGQLTLRINNFDAANYGHTALKAIPVIVLTDGTEIKGEEQSITLYDLMQTINDTADTYDAQQLAAVRDMIGQNPTMQTWGLVQLWSDSEAEAALQAEVAGITDNDALTEYFESYDAQGYVHLTPAGEAYVISPAGTPVILKNVVPTYVSRITAADFAQMLEIGQTYADNFANLTYGNNYTAINTTTTNEIDCSSFLKLVLSGVSYANSKYATDANTPAEGFGVEFPDNPYNSTYGADRYLSNEIAEYAWDNGMAFLPNEDASNIQPGDIVFFATRGEDYNGFFMDITHAAIFVESKGEQLLYVFQCGNNNGNANVNLVKYYTIDLNANNAYNDSLVLIARFPV